MRAVHREEIRRLEKQAASDNDAFSDSIRIIDRTRRALMSLKIEVDAFLSSMGEDKIRDNYASMRRASRHAHEILGIMNPKRTRRK